MSWTNTFYMPFLTSVVWLTLLPLNPPLINTTYNRRLLVLTNQIQSIRLLSLLTFLKRVRFANLLSYLTLKFQVLHIFHSETVRIFVQLRSKLNAIIRGRCLFMHSFCLADFASKRNNLQRNLLGKRIYEFASSPIIASRFGPVCDWLLSILWLGTLCWLSTTVISAPD